MKKIKVGIIGLGGISNKHLHELSNCENAEVVAICDIDAVAMARAKEKFGLNNVKCYSDYMELINDANVEAVEVCTPNYLHAEMAVAALNAGKHVNLEKPIALNYAQAQSITEAEERSGVFGMTCFSYRFMPAVRYAKSLVEQGKIGNIVGLNVAYLKSSAYWQGRALEWRFEKDKAGSGVVGDLGVHLIDLAQLLAGEIKELCATSQIAVKERPTLDGKSTGEVTTEDSCSFVARFECGAEGCFHITRCAIGHQNTIRYDVCGDRGAISFDLNDPSILMVAFGDGDPKYMKSETVKVPDEYYVGQEQTFINAVLGKRAEMFPTLADGAQGQRIVDAIIESSESGRWVRV